MTAADVFKITFIGKGAHASEPQAGVDSVVMAGQFISNAQSIVSRAVDPQQPAVLTIGKVNTVDGRFNVVCEETVLEGTVRTFHNEARDKVEAAVAAYADHIAAMHGGQVEVDYTRLLDAVHNQAQGSELLGQVVTDLYGADTLYPSKAIMASEDFGYYSQAGNGLFAVVGCGNAAKATNYSHHNAHFDIDEDGLDYGATLYATYVLAYLNQAKF